MWLKGLWKWFQKGIRYFFNTIFALLSWLKINHAPVLTLATVVLVVVTYCHMQEAEKTRGEIKRFADSTAGQLKEAEKMSGETKRLADITVKQLEESRKMRLENKRMADLMVEQFKIRSYPTFLLVPGEPTVENGKLVQKFAVHNKGDITAFRLTTLLVNSYTKDVKGLYLDIASIGGRVFNVDQANYYEYEGIKTNVDV